MRDVILPVRNLNVTSQYPMVSNLCFEMTYQDCAVQRVDAEMIHLEQIPRFRM